MSNGSDIDLRLMVDVPPDRRAQIEQNFRNEGYKVVSEQQDSGNFAIAAAK